MSVRDVGLDALSPLDLDSWHTLHATNPLFDSPYFHPGFARAVHDSGRPVSVLIARAADGSVTSLLPFHRDRLRMRPVGWPAADFQGPLTALGTTPDPLGLLAPGMRSYEFDHLVEVGDAFDPWISVRRASPFLDVTGGMDGYLGRASKSGRDNMGQARRRSAKAERDLGPLRFEADSLDDAVLDQVIELKRAQYAATGAKDYFSEPDRIALMHSLLHIRDTSFRGVLSTVHVGDQLLAAHFGMRAGKVLHWWFPVYDPALAALAPGWILLRELVLASPEMGIARIDLGRGDDEYKRRAKTGETTVCEGIVSSSAARRTVRMVSARSIAAVKASPLGPGLRSAARRWRVR